MNVPFPTSASATSSFSRSKSWLLVAFAAALKITLRTTSAYFFGDNAHCATASSTESPRTSLHTSLNWLGRALGLAAHRAHRRVRVQAVCQSPREGRRGGAARAGARRRGGGALSLVDPSEALPFPEDSIRPTRSSPRRRRRGPRRRARRLRSRGAPRARRRRCRERRGENARASASAANDAWVARADAGAPLARLSLARRANARPVSPRIPAPHARELPRTSVRNPNLLSRNARAPPRAPVVWGTVGKEVRRQADRRPNPLVSLVARCV